METINTDPNGAINYQSILEKRGMPFQISLTTNTIILQTTTHKIIGTEKDLNFKDLSFIKKVKNHIQKQECEREYTSNDVNYFSFNPRLNRDLFSLSVSEIDLSRAYWECAFRLKYINREIYEMGMRSDLRKELRLIALGSVASTKKHYFFDGEKYTDPDFFSDSNGKNIWFHISSKVSEIMEEIKSRIPDRAFYFYWVDAFFVRKDYTGNVSMLMERYGFGKKVVKANQIISFVNNDKRKIWVHSHEAGKDKKPGYKRFSFIDYKKGNPDNMNNFEI